MCMDASVLGCPAEGSLVCRAAQAPQGRVVVPLEVETDCGMWC